MAGMPIWYELMTSDPAGAKAFYDAVVGWDIDATGTDMPNGARYGMIRRSDGGHAGGLLGMTSAMVGDGARPGWIAYFHVDDVDVGVAAMLADGATVHMPAMTMPGVGRMAMLTDPWGAAFYVMTPQPPEGATDAVSDVFSVDRPQHVRWNELSTTDHAGAIAFYTRHFGWRQQGAMPMGDLGEYSFIQFGGTGIGAIMPKMPQAPASQWLHYIGVDDIDRAAAAVTAGGGTLFMDPMEIPGGEYSLTASDPQGAVFGLVGPRM